LVRGTTLQSMRISTCLLITMLTAGCGAASGPGAGSPGSNGEDSSGGSDSLASDGERGSAASIEARAPAAKTRALESRSIVMDFELTLLRGESPAGIQSGSWSLEDERSVEVVASKGDAIEKLAITYGRREEKPLLGIERTAATAGKSYVVDAASAEATVSRSDGSKPSAEERAAVLADYGWVGRPAPLLALLAGARLEPGTTLDASPDARRAIIGEISGIDPERTRLELRFVGLRELDGGRKSAALEASGVAILESGDMSFELSLAGPLLVDIASGFLRQGTLEGSVKASGTVKHKKGPLAAQGKGKVRLVRKAQL
jgi:hypothetical protein